MEELRDAHLAYPDLDADELVELITEGLELDVPAVQEDEGNRG